jgi:hypothetical protein
MLDTYQYLSSNLTGDYDEDTMVYCLPCWWQILEQMDDAEKDEVSLGVDRRKK